MSRALALDLRLARLALRRLAERAALEAVRDEVTDLGIVADRQLAVLARRAARAARLPRAMRGVPPR